MSERVTATHATFRRATETDVPAIVRLLADDSLGVAREDVDDIQPYLAAFRAIDADTSELLLVAVADEQIVATAQLSFLPGLARRGSLRAQLEAVRVSSAHRGNGLGTALLDHAAAEARQRGCAVMQLTSDKSRVDAHRFYERHGFVASHEGMKLPL